MLITLNWSYLYFFKYVYWVTESPVVEGKVEVDAGTGIISLSHPVSKNIKDSSNVSPSAPEI